MFASESIVAVWIPRFSLLVAAGGRNHLIGRPLALSPQLTGPAQIGETSPAAEAFGVRHGMGLSEALARCPHLSLLAPDPVGTQALWDTLLERLEGIGAEVESPRAGMVFFAEAALRKMYGGTRDNVLLKARRALQVAARWGAAPSRFCAFAAATQARPRQPNIVNGKQPQARAYLAQRSIHLLRIRPEVSDLVGLLERLGVQTLGELAALKRLALVERFGAKGELAHDLATGFDTPLRPRVAAEHLSETLDLPESLSGMQLTHAVSLLLNRLLARPERRARPLRSVVLAARLVEGGTWRQQVVFREALADRARIALVLTARLSSLPAPAQQLTLRVERFGPAGGVQESLLDEDDGSERIKRLREAAHQARLVAGVDAVLQVFSVELDSRVPERRIALTPWEA